MIYVLLGIAAFILLIWAGRRARPLLQRRELRIVSASLGSAMMIAGGFAALRGGYLIGAGLAAAGLGLTLSARTGVAEPSPGRRSSEDASVIEAREILGVSAGATREEIQAAYGRLIRAVHPDAGGTSGLAARLNAARDTLLKR
ncbi:MAG: DnaJ domain-containing protein [Pseudomonadota bacterium]